MPFTCHMFANSKITFLDQCTSELFVAEHNYLYQSDPKNNALLKRQKVFAHLKGIFLRNPCTDEFLTPIFLRQKSLLLNSVKLEVKIVYFFATFLNEFDFKRQEGSGVRTLFSLLTFFYKYIL